MKEVLEQKASHGIKYGGPIYIDDIICVGTKEYVIFKGSNNLNFFSTNCGKTVKPIMYDRNITEFKMHTNKRFVLAAAENTPEEHDNVDRRSIDLFLSKDFGETWEILFKYVYNFEWLYDRKSLSNHNILKRLLGHLTKHNGKIHPLSIMLTYDPKGTGKQNYHYKDAESAQTIISNDFFKTFKVINSGRLYLEKTNSFILNFNATDETLTGDDRADTFDIASGLDSFQSFRLAKFPYFKPLNINIYESYGQIFIESDPTREDKLGRDLYLSSHRGDEFIRLAHNIETIVTDISIEGVILINSYNIHQDISIIDSNSNYHSHSASNMTIYSSPKHKYYQSYISFNNGNTFTQIHNAYSQNGTLITGHDTHLHLDGTNILSHILSRGIIVGNGNIGHYYDEEASDRSMFVSTDGGVSFTKVVEGDYAFSFADRGSMIVAGGKREFNSSFIYSMDYGKTWIEHRLSAHLKIEKIYSDSLLKSKYIFILGYTEDYEGQVLLSIDFEGINLNNCRLIDTPGVENSDYEYVNFQGHNDTCINGGKYKLIRRKMESECLIEEHKMEYYISPCQCTEEDYQCDFGYEKCSQTKKCVPIANFAYASYLNEQCSNEDYYYSRTGYKKTPYNRCIGGIDLEPIRHLCTFSIFSLLHGVLFSKWSRMVILSILGTIILILFYFYFDFGRSKYKDYYDLDNDNGLENGFKAKNEELVDSLHLNFEDEKQKLW